MITVICSVASFDSAPACCVQTNSNAGRSVIIVQGPTIVTDCSILDEIPVAYLDVNKMEAILQPTFSNAFSWEKSVVFLF